jgi:hypothetical protein
VPRATRRACRPQREVANLLLVVFLVQRDVRILGIGRVKRRPPAAAKQARRVRVLVVLVVVVLHVELCQRSLDRAVRACEKARHTAQPPQPRTARRCVATLPLRRTHSRPGRRTCFDRTLLPGGFGLVVRGGALSAAVVGVFIVLLLLLLALALHVVRTRLRSGELLFCVPAQRSSEAPLTHAAMQGARLMAGQALAPPWPRPAVATLARRSWRPAAAPFTLKSR